ncbi:hypothetical protein [Chromobacterium paludis]|uniref:Uncharacterized protein n=1 Tax=Chromobacterium paludis TaxID=2605945 RepID=A0A5C1DKG3_9NEIS|nr:hypothetical protein [Chromobacterium paludis]QEL57195.1 hypothetical protein FYK34_17330 [Chromobacterium paludis]
MKPQGNASWWKDSRAAMMLSLGLLCGQAPAAAEGDCSQAIAPQRCQLYRQGALSCQDLDSARRRDCLAYYTPPLNCQRQRDAKRCEALVAAQASCEGAVGQARRQCVNERLPGADCARKPPPCQPQDERCDGDRRRDAGWCQPPVLLGD